MERFWTLLSEMYRTHGGRAYLAYPRITTLPPSIEESTIQAVELTMPWTTSAQRREALRFIQDNHIEAVYFTDQPWFSPQYLVLRCYGIKTIVVHDHTPGDRPPVIGIKGIVKAARNRLPALCADYTFCVSPLMRDRNRTNGRQPAKRLLVVQNGIPVTESRSNRQQIRRALGIDDMDLVVITTGRAHPYKRFDLVIRTAAYIREYEPTLRIAFLIVGDGPDYSALEDLTRELGAEESVRLLGFRPDAKDLLAAADIAMHAALGEGFSLSIVEYMHAELPVLVPNIPSVMQAIEHDVTGLIYERDSVRDAASHVLTLAKNAQIRSQIGKRAKEAVLKHYTLDKCDEAFIQASRTAFGLG